VTFQGSLFEAECAHSHRAELKERPSSIHYAREICSDCGRFLRWVPNPKTLLQRERNAQILTALSKRVDLDEWTREFVRSVSQLKSLSPKQQQILNKLDAELNANDRADNQHGAQMQ
jgi:hypothetical protein